MIPIKSKVARFKDFLGDLRWEDFSQADLERYTDYARTITRWGREDEAGLSDGSIAKDLQVLRSSLRHAHLHKKVPYEPWIEIRRLASKQRTDWLTKEHYKKVIACCGDDEREHIYAFLLLALASGARNEAIFELKWDKIYIPEADTSKVIPFSGPRRVAVAGGREWREPSRNLTVVENPRLTVRVV